MITAYINRQSPIWSQAITLTDMRTLERIKAITPPIIVPKEPINASTKVMFSLENNT